MMSEWVGNDNGMGTYFVWMTVSLFRRGWLWYSRYTHHSVVPPSGLSRPCIFATKHIHLHKNTFLFEVEDKRFTFISPIILAWLNAIGASPSSLFRLSHVVTASGNLPAWTRDSSFSNSDLHRCKWVSAEWVVVVSCVRWANAACVVNALRREGTSPDCLEH